MDKKRQIIAVLSAQIPEDEQRDIIVGIIDEAQKHDTDIVVLSNLFNTYYDDEDYFSENDTYDLVFSDDIDGVIITSEAFQNSNLKEMIRRISRNIKVPVIVTGAPVPFIENDNITYVHANDMEDIEKLTEHLITNHGLKKIQFLSGPFDSDVSQSRIQGFQNALDKYGLPFSDEEIIEGDFWYDSGAKLAKSYASGERKLPEAIVCANSYMAYSLIDNLLRARIFVPDDVTVVCYECTDSRIRHLPVVTGFRRNRKELGRAAVKAFFQEENTDNSILDGELVIGKSCGCRIDVEEYLKTVDNYTELSRCNEMMLHGHYEFQLTSCRRLEDYLRALSENIYLIGEISGMYLLLDENWCNEENKHSSFFHFYRFNPEPSAPVYCGRCDFVTVLKYAKSAMTYYYSPLFFLKHMMGYIVLLYDHPQVYGFNFREWMKSAGIGLEFLLMKSNLNHFTKVQELSETYDNVTKIYNATGFWWKIKFLELAAIEKSVLLVLIKIEAMSIDSEAVTTYNGEKAVMVTAAVLKHISEEKAVYARLDSATFVIALSGEYTADDASFYKDFIESTLRVGIGQSGCNMVTLLLDATISGAGCSDVETAVEELKCHIQDRQIENSKKRFYLHYTELEQIREMAFNRVEGVRDMKQVCKALLMSTGYFQNLYKKYFGTSYLHDQIVGKCFYSKYYLAVTKQTTTALASKCGYDDEKHFIKQFRKYVGITTSAYRSQIGRFINNDIGTPDFNCGR